MNSKKPEKQPKYLVAALYKFTPLPDFETFQSPLLEACNNAHLTGTLLLASEGINGTIAGSRQGLDDVLAHIRRIPGCADIEHKESFARVNPFHRMRVRLKKEIVTMGIPNTDPNVSVGKYIAPEDWNELISDTDVILIDTRNDYEVGIGTFKDAIDPKTTTFREFPEWFRANKEPLGMSAGKTKVAMFCTGGIRCEKATAFVKNEGIDEVYHLKGGILKYLETVPSQESLWEGECFVFDERVSVGHGLALGPYDLCHACRHPIDDQDKASPHFTPGVSCPKCYNEKSDEQRKRFQERQRQMELANKRGERHIGAVYKKSH